MAKPARIGRDGWISLEVDDDLRAHLHLTRRGGELVVDGLYLDADQITTDTLRRVHPARIVAAASKQLHQGTKTIRWSKDVSQVGQTSDVTTTGETLARLVTQTPADDAATTLGDLRGRARGRRIIEQRREALGRPDDPDRLDDFYGRVAAAYTSAAATSGRPGAVLAEENEVPVDTVHRWVKEARRRGHLAPGRRGVAG